MSTTDNSSRVLPTIGLLLILLPFIFGFTFSFILPRTPTPWHADMGPSLDTYVSSNDTIDHSFEHTIIVGRYSANGTQTTEIGLIWLTMAPPPGPAGSLTAITLYIHCTEVLQAGIIRIHKLQNSDSWDVDTSTLNFTNMPAYDSEEFASLNIGSEGVYNIDLLAVGGFTGYSTGGIALIANIGSHVIFTASESGEESHRPYVRLSGESDSFGFSPLGQALVSYLNPISWIPFGVGIVLLAYFGYLRFKSKSLETTTL